MHKKRYGKKGMINPHRGRGAVITAKARTGQQKTKASASYIAGGIGHRIDRYPAKDKATRRGRYLKELT